MSFSNTAETAINTYIFKGDAVSWSGNTNLWLALHTADPGEAGSMAAESTYGGYVRVAISRASGFTISGPTVQNAALVQFPLCVSSSSVCTHVSIVDTSSGAATVIVSGALNSSVTVTPGIQPQFAVNALTFTLD